MSPEQITQLIRETLYVALEISAPFLILALVVGILVSLLQTVTHIQEMTLSFVPKMLSLVLALAILFPWILKIMVKFTNNILVFQWGKVVAYIVI